MIVIRFAVLLVLPALATCESCVTVTASPVDPGKGTIRRSIQTAFREVSDALIAHQRQHESRVEQETLVTALQDRK
jgi:hypothetical protein